MSTLKFSNFGTSFSQKSFIWIADFFFHVTKSCAQKRDSLGLFLISSLFDNFIECIFHPDFGCFSCFIIDWYFFIKPHISSHVSSYGKMSSLKYHWDISNLPCVPMKLKIFFQFGKRFNECDTNCNSQFANNSICYKLSISINSNLYDIG